MTLLGVRLGILLALFSRCFCLFNLLDLLTLIYIQPILVSLEFGSFSSILLILFLHKIGICIICRVGLGYFSPNLLVSLIME
jgi:hypothetical protein